MRILLVVAPALLFAGAALGQQAGRPDPRDPQRKAPPAEYRSAFESYRPYHDPELRDWRKSNEKVAQPPKPQPGKPQTSGHGEHK
jgi:hypothetical protein